MCTVCFFPNNKKIYFASLRDENPLRAKANYPEVLIKNEISLLSPIDSAAGGTWIGVNHFNTVIILLNGGTVNHIKKEKYAKSRGLIVIELLSSSAPLFDWKMMCLENIEPFTLIVWTDNNLFQLLWDGVEKKKIILNKTIAHIWSSSTLYNEEAKLIRKIKFDQWIKSNPLINQETLLAFFETYKEKSNGFLMHRNEFLKTLSFSFIEVEENDQAIFNYNDLDNKEKIIKKIDLNPVLISI